MRNLEEIKQLPYYLDDNGKAIKLTPIIARDIFAYMQAKFHRGDGKGNSDWVENQMFAFIDKRYQFYLGDWKTFAGWTIVIVENLPEEHDGFYIVFYKQITPMGAVKVLAPIASDKV